MYKQLFLKHINKREIKYKIIIYLTIIIAILAIIIYNNIQENNGIIINSIPLIKSKNKNSISVYISGEVQNEGRVLLNKNSTIKDAIDKAGGITENANINSIDLDKKAKDCDKIVIVAKKVEEYNQGKEVDNIININLGSKEELMELPGIGEKTAENIIEYRSRNKFNIIEDIMEVKGIGEGKFEKIEEYICT